MKGSRKMEVITAIFISTAVAVIVMGILGGNAVQREADRVRKECENGIYDAVVELLKKNGKNAPDTVKPWTALLKGITPLRRSSPKRIRRLKDLNISLKLPRT